MQRIGITGGIGSGKSRVCELLQDRGWPVYDADSRAKRVMHENPRLRLALVEHFGPETFTSEGQLNRPYLAARVFNNPTALATLNQLVHPVVAQDFEAWCSHQEALGARAVFKEAAILIESGAHRGLDGIWLVTAPLEVRLARIRQRDGLPDDQILDRIARQWTDDQRRPFCSLEICNDGTQPLDTQVADALARTLTPPDSQQRP
jgi:dephospho-CoA kinase